MRLAYFISPHGFGHAARAAAVIEAVRTRLPQLEFSLFTTVPRWFFEESLSRPVTYHEVVTDVGLVQRGPLVEDVAATLDRLATLVPPPAETVDSVTRLLERDECSLVVSDISPLGLWAARRAGLPSILVENFTWDWIYRAYEEGWPELRAIADTLASIFASATLRIQAEPFCCPVDDSVTVVPIGRRPLTPRDEIRRRLGIGANTPMILLTMGGVEFDYRGLASMAGQRQWTFVVPGGADREERDGSLIRLPHHSRFYHPDLVHASDLVVGKIGYSTLAEVYDAGAAYAFIGREVFPESPVIGSFACEHLNAVEISSRAFDDCSWLDVVPSLLEAPRMPRGRARGARQVAELIAERL